MMEIQYAETQVRRFKASIEALEAAKQPAMAAFKAGLPEFEAAPEAQRALLVEFLDQFAATDVWHRADFARLIGVVDISWRLIDLETGGLLLRLIVHLGDKYRRCADIHEDSRR